MLAWAYLAALATATGGLLMVDRRWRLAGWAAPRRTLVTVAAGVGFFLTWDVAAIAAGVYARGGSPAMTGLTLAPELPVEEVVFVAFFSYLTLIVYAGAARLLGTRRASRPTSTSAAGPTSEGVRR